MLPKGYVACGFYRDCPRTFTASQLTAVGDKASASKLMKRKRMAQNSCIRSGEMAVQHTGGWCYNHTHAFQHTLSVDIPYLVPFNHVPADDHIVEIVSRLLGGRQGGCCHSLNDLGAGVGQYGHALLARLPRLQYRGFDGGGNVEEFTHGFIHYADLTQVQSIPSADYVMSLEVGEHIPHEHEKTFIRNLHAANRCGLILSWAVLEQGGFSHINCHSNGYLIDLLGELGYSLNRIMTDALRHGRPNGAWWFKHSIMMFDRKDRPPTCESAAVRYDTPTLAEPYSPRDADPIEAWRAPNCSAASALFAAQQLGRASKAAQASLAGKMRVAVQTLLSPADAGRRCAYFMRYYTEVQHVAAVDIYVIEIAAGSEPGHGVSKFARCYRMFSIPRLNIFRRIYGDESVEKVTRRLAPDVPIPFAAFILRNSTRPLEYDEGWRMRIFSELQNHLIASERYTHTMVVDVDELVWPDARKYSDLYDYLHRNSWRAVVAAAGHSVYETKEEAPLQWSTWNTTGLLHQRRYWCSECGYSKPVISRVPVRFSFATHEIEQLPYNMCGKRPLDCADPDLLLIHMKCIDTRLASDMRLAKHFTFSHKHVDVATRCGIADKLLAQTMGNQHSDEASFVCKLPTLIPEHVKRADVIGPAIGSG